MKNIGTHTVLFIAIFATALVSLLIGVAIGYTINSNRLLNVKSNSVIESTNKFNNRAPVPQYMKTCNNNNDCTFVETRCNSCCGFVGINKNFEQGYYDEIYSVTCSGYEGVICDCLGPTNPFCSDGLCEVK